MRPLWSAPAGADHELGYQLGRAYLSLAMKTRNEVKRLTDAVRRAERELDAARTFAELKPAARELKQLKAELRWAEQNAVEGS
jgi:hypothetical protein